MLAPSSTLKRRPVEGYKPRTNAIDLNTLGSPFVAHCFGHLKNTALGSRIWADVDVCNERDDTRHVDNFPGPIEL